MAPTIQLSPAVTGTVDFDEVAIHLHPEDHVAIAKLTLAPGVILRRPEGDVSVRQMVHSGHKVALLPRAVGEPVRRYGQIIGFATVPIAAGDHVHSHNLAVAAFQRDYAYCQNIRPVVYVLETQRRTFLGFRRPNGKVGTRNYLAVISSVNCSASVSRYVAERFRGEALREYCNIDGVVALTHSGGCGAHYGGAEVDLLQRTLAGFARHPNVAGYVLMGLGCEVNQIPDMVERQAMGEATSLIIQDQGGLVETVEAGVAAVSAMLPAANQAVREAIPASEITLALQCGGSDAWSGVTANPALGKAADLIVAQGGTVVLGETTEVYGGEHLLTRRAVSEAVGRKLVDQIEWWERYTAMNGAEIDNNPTPGNKMGGLTTIFEKSLGAIAKSGTTPMTDVIGYAEPITSRGFVHMDTPGFDPVSVTGQVAGGCNVIVFTTGRGSVFGCRPVPSIKVASNSGLFARMSNDMDFNAGRILEGDSLDAVGQDLFDLILEVASGSPTHSEVHGIGEEEFAPWILGATL